MAIFVRILRHTFRYPLQSSLSLLLAIGCTLLVLVLPGISMDWHRAREPLREKYPEPPGAHLRIARR